MPLKILIATSNRDKTREIKAALKDLPFIDIYSFFDFPQYIAPEETGATFKENAELKAKDAATKLQMWVLADDSGLVVPALKGAPGVYSKRYASLNATDKENRKKLLENMLSFQQEKRTAFFECALCLCSPEGKLHFFEGSVSGSISEEEKGSKGFGYDPLFIKEGFGKTFGEIEETVKNKISHRGKALEKFISFISRMEV